MHITVHPSIFGIIKIYMPGAGCVVLVVLALTAMVIFRKKNAHNVPTGTLILICQTI